MLLSLPPHSLAPEGGSCHAPVYIQRPALTLLVNQRSLFSRWRLPVIYALCHWLKYSKRLAAAKRLGSTAVSADGMTEVLFKGGDIIQLRFNDDSHAYRWRVIKVFGADETQQLDSFGSGGLHAIMTQVDEGILNRDAVNGALTTYTENELISLFTPTTVISFSVRQGQKTSSRRRRKKSSAQPAADQY